MKKFIIGITILFLISCESINKENNSKNIDNNINIQTEKKEKNNFEDFFSNSTLGKPIFNEIKEDKFCLINNGKTELLEMNFNDSVIIYGVNENTCNKYEEGVGINNLDIWSIPQYSNQNPLINGQKIGNFYVSYGEIGYGPLRTYGIYFWSDSISVKKYKQFFGTYVLFIGNSDNNFNKYSELIKNGNILELPEDIKNKHENIINFIKSI